MKIDTMEVIKIQGHEPSGTILLTIRIQSQGEYDVLEMVFNNGTGTQIREFQGKSPIEQASKYTNSRSITEWRIVKLLVNRSLTPFSSWPIDLKLITTFSQERYINFRVVNGITKCRVILIKRKFLKLMVRKNS